MIHKNWYITCNIRTHESDHLSSTSRVLDRDSRYLVGSVKPVFVGRHCGIDLQDKLVVFINHMIVTLWRFSLPFRQNTSKTYHSVVRKVGYMVIPSLFLSLPSHRRHTSLPLSLSRSDSNSISEKFWSRYVGKRSTNTLNISRIPESHTDRS